jgi:regulator of replication initiation timing
MTKVISSFPCLDPARGELCYLSSTTHDKRIQCNIFGQVMMNTNRKGWEVWCLSKVEGTDGVYLITSRTHDRKVLCSDPDGTVRTTENKRGDWEKWKIQRSDDGVIIRSVAHDRVLWTDGHTLRTECYDGRSDSEDCLWCLEPANTNYFFLSSHASDKRVGCTPNGAVFTTDNRNDWEHWVIEFVGSGDVVIKSYAHHNEARYLTVQESKTVTMGRNAYPWHVKPSCHGGVTLYSAACKMFLACNPGVHGVILALKALGVKDRSINWTLEPRLPNTSSVISKLPCVEPSRGELFFISNTHRNRRIQCNIYGHLKMTTNWKGWEVWCFSPVHGSDGVFLITSWTHDQKVLCSDPDGTVRTTENKRGDWEKWRLHRHLDDGVIIQLVAHDRVLWTDGHTLRTECYDNRSNKEDCLLCLEPANTNHFFLSSNASDKRVGCTPDRAVFTTDNRNEWEHWVIEFVGSGAVVIKSYAHHNEARYLTVQDGTTVTMGNDSYTWHMEPSRHGGVKLCSTACKMFLACNPGVDGVSLALKVHGADDESTSWTLEPRMPDTVCCGAPKASLFLIVS